MADIFINHLIDLVIKERDEEERLTTRLLKGSPFELEEKGVAILNLCVEREILSDSRIRNISVMLVPAHPETYPPRIPKHKLTVGDMVEIKEDFSETNCGDALSGIVSKKDKSYILIDVYCRNRFGNSVEAHFSDSMKSLCHIVKLPNNITYKRMLEALTDLKTGYHCGSPLYNVLLGRSYPSNSDSDEAYGMDFFDVSLNESQEEAVKFSIGSPEVALIHGPPGTGKTHTLIEIIRQLVENKYMKVLVCGPSNIAVDNLLERVMEYEKIYTVRVGNISRVSKSVIERTLEVLAFEDDDTYRVVNIIKKEIDELNEKLKSQACSQEKKLHATENSIQRLFKRSSSLEARMCMNDVISKADVVFCTLNAAGSVPMLGRKFDIVIVDEAAQATEPDCWIALTKGRKLILAGDHLQLPPTVKSISEANKTKIKGMSIHTDLSYTLFDRLIEMYGDNIKVMLSVQYRMHEKIMQFSSQELYDNKLFAHYSVTGHLLSGLTNTSHSQDTNAPVVLIDTSDTIFCHETKDSKKTEERSTSNELETYVVFSHIERLINEGGLRQDQIGVITPYAAQVTKLNEVLSEKWKHIEIESVDGFQGREKEAIIISMVRSNPRGDVGFLAEKRRLNVAMTRAKRHLVVIGDIRTLSGLDAQFSPSSIDRGFLTKWIDWLDEESEKRFSTEYISFSV